MTVARHLLANPGIAHGPIRIAFTPDEEIGRGVHADLPKDLGADVAYTLDGGPRGEIVYETFSADKADGHDRGRLDPSRPGQGPAGQRAPPGGADRRHPAPGHPHPGDHRRPPGLHPPLRDERHRRRRRAQVHPARLRARRAGRPRRPAEPGLRRRPGRRAARPHHLHASRRSTATCATGWSTTCGRSSWRWRPAGRPASTPFSLPIRGGTDGSRLTEMGVPTPEPLHRHAGHPRAAGMDQRPGHGRRRPGLPPPRRALGRRAHGLSPRFPFAGGHGFLLPSAAARAER